MIDADDPLAWPRVHENERVKFSELRVGDYVPGYGIIRVVDHKKYKFAANGSMLGFNPAHWETYGFQGVRRRYIIEEEPV